MESKVLNYYVSGNTAKGFHSFLVNNLIGLEKLFILKGELNTVKSKLMRAQGNDWMEKENDVEFLHSPINNELIEGVINRSKRIALISDSGNMELDLGEFDFDIEYFDFNQLVDNDVISSKSIEINTLKESIKVLYENAYSKYYAALKIHDEWEEIYINNMDKKRADGYTQEVIEMLLKDHKLDKTGITKDRFFGAATPLGPVDYVEQITSNISKRYFIKGRPGTGKSTMLKRLVKEAEKRGFDVDVYHCGFDPNSLDMVLINELDFVIFDSTAPHEYFPTKENDEIIDMYQIIIKHGTDEKYQKQLDQIILRYKLEVDAGTTFLNEVKDKIDELEKIYMNLLDLDELTRLAEEIFGKLSK